MFQFAPLQQLSECFEPLERRRQKQVFFCRLTGYSNAVASFIQKYYEEARKSGVVIDGRVQNPEPRQLSYYLEIMGPSFSLNLPFLQEQLRKWLPRMSARQNQAVSAAMLTGLQEMQNSGKNDNILKNAYMKYMCWLYYKFERITNALGTEPPPKILYTGELSQHELQLLMILSRAGADIILLEYDGGQNYHTLDPAQQYASCYTEPGLKAFPKGFSLEKMQREAQRSQVRQRLSGEPPAFSSCTNAWMDSPRWDAAATHVRSRGEDPHFFYNTFILMQGVEDKLTYKSDLFSLYQAVIQQHRKICVVEQSLPRPTPEEVSAIQRASLSSIEQLVSALAANIQCRGQPELQKAMRSQFIQCLLAEGDQGVPIKRLENRAVYLLCWLKRYQQDLFSNWRFPEIPVFILFGSCATEGEALFLRFLSKLPVDVLVLTPDRSKEVCLRDESLLTIQHANSYPVDAFPVSQSHIRVGTAAYEAERELDAILYQDSGIYRSYQHTNAAIVTLQTMYEEIPILWDQEVKYRPNFSTQDDQVTMPVILEKISGVQHGDHAEYWASIQRLLTPDTLFVRALPWLSSTGPNPMKPFATEFLKRGTLLKQRIKEHPAYPYRILREETQEYMLSKLQLLLDQKWIKGTYCNGTEYTIISTVLHLERQIVQLIQKFDFTQKNPKLVFLITDEKQLSLEESILVAYLHLVGFDIVFFVPTGYRCIEQHFSPSIITEQQIGPFIYNLQSPNFERLEASPGRLSLKERLFGRRH